MENKFRYRVKLDILNEMAANIAVFRGLMAELTENENLADHPDVSEFFPLGGLLEDLEVEVESLAGATEPLAAAEKKSI